jgi:hypothetical protein
MKVRRLQRQDKRDQWYDDAYAYENETGQVIFCYNLTWDRVGSTYNGKLQESGVSLEAIETVLQPGDRFRWLPVEVVAEEEVEAFLEALDEACAIPKPRPIKMVHPMEEG